jgi:hypothetical protein
MLYAYDNHKAMVATPDFTDRSIGLCAMFWKYAEFRNLFFFVVHRSTSLGLYNLEKWKTVLICGLSTIHVDLSPDGCL